MSTRGTLIVTGIVGAAAFATALYVVMPRDDAPIEPRLALELPPPLPPPPPPQDDRDAGVGILGSDAFAQGGAFATLTGTGDISSGFDDTDFGTGRGGTASTPSTRIGQPTTQGSLDKAIIRRYIKRNLAKITYCYEKELLAKPGLEGTVETRFVIGSDGSVSTATVTGLDATVATCITGVIMAIQFPEPTDGGGVTVSYPFTFAPASP